MKYSIRMVPAGTTSAIDVAVWEVLKTPTNSADPYLIATFHHPCLARWCLSSLRGSVEVQRWGAEMDEPPADPKEFANPIYDAPDELIW